jgi:ketosteroid isomerase-like protein
MTASCPSPRMIADSMRNHSIITLTLVALTSASCNAVPVRPPPAVAAPASPSLAACAVWDREVEFARSVQDHDARAFAEHVHPGAVFVEGDALQRGRDAVVKSWEGLLRGDKMRIDWHPTSVVMTGDPRVALSRGPYWIEVLKPDAKERFLTGVYQSVWLLDEGGVWRVTIDGGTPPAVPASAADVEKIKASLPTKCPAGG